MTGTSGEMAKAATAPLEHVLAEVLAGVAQVDRVPADSHFFDDLGANSLTMAHFCARLRKIDGVPAVSMRDVYGHPTIRDLAAALGSTPADARPPALLEAEPPPPGSTPRHILCGVLQLLAFALYCAASGIVTAEGYAWISAADGPVGVYLRSALSGGAVLVGVCALPVAAKWLLVGRWTETEFPVWSLAYVRFWLVRTLIRTSPMALLPGSPLYVLYLRALGARIGRGVTILSRTVPVCTDLLSVGDGTLIRKDCHFLCYQVYAGRIRTGPVRIGCDVLVGERTVLETGTRLGDRARLAHSSALHQGMTVPAGQTWHGSPARPAGPDLPPVPPAPHRRGRRAAYAALGLSRIFLVGVPLAVGGGYLLLDRAAALDTLLRPSGGNLLSPRFCAVALTVSLTVFGAGVVLGLVAVTTVPRLLGVLLRPGRVHPLYGFRWSVHRSLVRLTNRPFFTLLSGDSSYVVPYLRALGYRLTPVEQTGSNFGNEVRQDSPFLTSVGRGTMIADGLSVINVDYSATSFRLAPAAIGARNFLGNDIAFPAGARTGDNCLLATKVMVPLDGEVRENVGLLGSPPFEIPRTVERDTRFDHLREGPEQRRLLTAKNRYNARTIVLWLFLRWLHWFLLTLLGFAAVDLYPVQGAARGLLIGASLFLAVFLTVGYYVLIERLLCRFRPLEPRLCSIYDSYFWWHERLWKVPSEVFAVFDGTPFKSVVWRLLGVRIGRRVLDDGCHIAERTLTTIGDDTVLGPYSTLQAHSQEDGTFKSDRITLGTGCTVGTGALVHYGVVMGDGSVLAADSFLMKGEQVPPRSCWGGNPAAALRITTTTAQHTDQHGGTR